MNLRHLMRHCAALCIAIQTCFLCAGAQTFSRQEAGVGLEAQTAGTYVNNGDGIIPLPDYNGPIHIFPGPFGRYTWNLSPSLALEGGIGYLPGYQFSYGVDNGHELLAVGGVKAGWRGRRFGVFGTTEPGIASYSPGLKLYTAPGISQFHRRTNFALNYGGAFEYYPSNRTILRLDLTQTLVSGFDQVLLRSSSGLPAEVLEGHVAQHLGVGFSIAHRFGALKTETEKEPARANVDTGVLYSLYQRVSLGSAALDAWSGGGA